MPVETEQAELELYRQWMEKIAKVCESIAQGDLEARLIGAPSERGCMGQW